MAAKILLKEKQEVEVVVSQYDELLLLIDDAKTLQAMVSEGLVEEDMETLATDIFKKLEAVSENNIPVNENRKFIPSPFLSIPARNILITPILAASFIPYT